jgi:hypothetical protein
VRRVPHCVQHGVQRIIGNDVVVAFHVAPAHGNAGSASKGV